MRDARRQFEDLLRQMIDPGRWLQPPVMKIPSPM
jgi:hypothetical protein